MPVKSINDTSGISVKKGERFFYNYTVHPSVGRFIHCEISDNSVVSLDKCEEKYRKTPKPGTTGGDLTDGKYTYIALKPGTVKIKISRDFRGHVDREDIIEITVSD
jgi:hypothetical protein